MARCEQAIGWMGEVPRFALNLSGNHVEPRGTFGRQFFYWQIPISNHFLLWAKHFCRDRRKRPETDGQAANAFQLEGMADARPGGRGMMVRT